MKKCIIVSFCFVFAFLIYFCPLANASDIDLSNRLYETANEQTLDIMPNSFEDQVLSDGQQQAEQNIFLNLKQVFENSIEDLKQNMNAPLRLVSSVVGIVVLSIALSSFEGNTVSSGVVGFVYSLATASIVIVCLGDFFEVVKTTIDQANRFTTEFLAVYSGVLISAGAVTTSAMFGSILLIASKVFSVIIVSIISPLNGVMLGVSIAKGSDEIGLTNITQAAKKLVIFSISILTAAVIAVAKLQISVSSAVDTASIKAGKYIVGTAIPIIGSSVSGAMGTVSGGLVTAKNGVGITGITIVSSLFLPVIIQGIVLVFSLKICEGLAFSVSNNAINGTLSAIRSAVEINIALIVSYFLIVIFSISSVVSFYS